MTQNKNLIEVARYGTNAAIIEFMKQAEDEDYTFSQDALDISLIESCNRGLKTLVQFVVCLGANVNNSRKNGDTPLIISAWKGFTDICKLLLKKGAHVNASNNDGDTPLMAAVQPSGSIELIHLLLEQDNVDVDHQNKNGGTALMKAIEVLNLDVVILLLNSGASLDGRSTPTGAKSACVEIVNSKGESAQDIADRLNIGNIINLLRNANNQDPLIAAALKRDLESVKFLVETMYISQNCYGVLVQLLKSIKMENKSVSRDELSIFKSLLNAGFDVNWPSESGEHPIALAVELGSSELVELFCSFGAQISHDHLVSATKQGRNDIISLLLLNGAPVNKYTGNQVQYQESAMDIALTVEQIHTANKLFNLGAYLDIEMSITKAVNSCNKKALSFILTLYPYAQKTGEDAHLGLLHSAVQGGDVDIVNILLNCQADVNCVYKYKTPLMLAFSVDMIELLISRGADVNQRTQTTALLNVFSSEFYEELLKTLELTGQAGNYNVVIKEIIETFAKHHANVNASTCMNETTLMLAAQKDKFSEAVKLLLDAGVDVNAEDYLGKTALFHAVECKRVENCQVLLQHGAFVDCQTLDGSTPLHEAFKSGTLDIVELLLKHDANLQIQDNDGNTPLIISIKYSLSSSTTKALIEAGAKLDVQNDKGKTALIIAAKHAYRDEVDLLLKAGADPNLVDNQSETALTVLFNRVDCEDFSLECASSLLDHGSTVQFVHPEMIHRLTSLGWSRVVQQLIQRGLPPSEIVFLKNSCGWPTSTPVTPFSVALLMENIELASFMLDVWYLTPSDVRTLSGQTSVTDSLRRKGLFRSVKFLEEVTTRPMTLEQLCFINISLILGTEEEREYYIENLPLPNIFKRKFNFEYKEMTSNTDSGFDIKLKSTERKYILENNEDERKVMLYHYIAKYGSIENSNPSLDLLDFSDDESDDFFDNDSNNDSDNVSASLHGFDTDSSDSVSSGDSSDV